jgi:3-oxoadipate enol-lactonase
VQVVHANRVNIHVRRDTTGGAGAAASAPLALVNSLGTDLRLWDGVLAQLPAGLQVIRSDKRGHGLSDAPAPPYAMADLAADLAGVLDALETGPAVVAGISVGGMIALQLALDRPDLVRGLVLLDTGAKIATATHWNERIANVETQGLRALADGIVQGWVTERFRTQRPGETAAWRNMVARTPAPDGYAGVCAALRDTDLTGRLSEIHVPALCLCGSDDTSTPPDLMRALSDGLPHGRYGEIADTRHLPCIEAPASVAGHIAELLSETRGD